MDPGLDIQCFAFIKLQVSDSTREEVVVCMDIQCFAFIKLQVSDSISMDANLEDKWMWTETVIFFASRGYTWKAVPFLLSCWGITMSAC